MINTQFITNEYIICDQIHEKQVVYKSLKNKNIIRNTVVAIIYQKGCVLEYFNFESDGTIREKPLGRLENGFVDNNGLIRLTWKEKPIDHYLVVSYEFIVRKNVPLMA